MYSTAVVPTYWWITSTAVCLSHLYFRLSNFFLDITFNHCTFVGLVNPFLIHSARQKSLLYTGTKDWPWKPKRSSILQFPFFNYTSFERFKKIQEIPIPRCFRKAITKMDGQVFYKWKNARQHHLKTVLCVENLILILREWRGHGLLSWVLLLLRVETFQLPSTQW